MQSKTSDSTRPRVYVAGPISAPTLIERKVNVLAGIWVCDELLKAGFAPFNPFLSCYWDDLHPGNDYEDWMALDFAFIKVCDAFLKIFPSPRADREEKYALSLDIPVFNKIEDVISHFSKENV